MYGSQMGRTTERLRGRRAVEARASYLRLHPLCKHCLAVGRVELAVEVDHVVPLFKGGDDTSDNKQGLCKPCHADKTAQDMGHLVKRTVGLDGWPIA